MENPYYISELEGEDHYCECCGRQLRTSEYLDYNGICEECFLIEMEIINDNN